MGIEVGGMIIGLIINVLQLESESLEQLFLPSLWCDITCCPNPTPYPRHVWPPVDQSIYFPHFPSYIDYEIYKYKITPAVVGCKDKRKGEPPKL